MSDSPEKIPSSEQAEFEVVNLPQVPPPPYNALRNPQAPSYTPPTDPAASTSSTTASKGDDKKAVKPLQPLKPTDPRPDDSEYMASLRAWGRDQEYINDNFGGHKGVASGAPNDPFKVFRWVGRRLSGQPTDGGRSKSQSNSSPLLPGEVVDGDVDTHTVV